MRALIYVRASQDQHDDAGSVEAQEAELRSLCDAHGWTVVDVYADNDLGASAFSPGVRESWLETLERIDTGDVDVLVCTEVSRLARDAEEAAMLFRLLRETEVQLHAGGSLLNLEQPGDKLLVGVQSLFAEYEALLISIRVKRGRRAAARRGVPGRSAFGYRYRKAATGRAVGIEVDSDTAPIVQRIFTEAAAGKSSRAIATELTDDGLPTPRGAKWNVAAIRAVRSGRVDAPDGITTALAAVTAEVAADVARDADSNDAAKRRRDRPDSEVARRLNAANVPNPAGSEWVAAQVARILDNRAYLGELWYQGELIPNPDGGPWWEPLATVEQHDAAKAYRLSRDAAPSSHAGNKRTARLCTGVGRCGACGSKIVAARSRGAAGGEYYYRCKAAGCFGRNMGRVDQLIGSLIVRRFQLGAAGTADDTEPQADRDAVMGEIEDLEQRRSEFAEMAAAGSLKPDAFARVDEQIGTQLIAAGDRLRALTVPLSFSWPSPDAAAEHWVEMSPAGRRDTVNLLCETITIHPAAKGHDPRGFEPDLVDVTWRNL